MEPANARAENSSESFLLRFLSSTPKFLLLLAGYFLLQIILRLITSGTTDLDESEQLLATQHLQWGYGPQPPLYTWLLYPLVHLSGPGLLALTVFKNALLFGLYAVMYACARILFRDPVRNTLAALSLLFLPQVAWEAQRDLTHSVLVTFLSATTFLVVLRLRCRPHWRLYGALGLCLGAGILSKYSFLVFAAGLLIAMVAVPSFRQILKNPFVLLTLLICGLVITPHLVWAADHRDWVAATATKFKIATGQSWFKTTLTGIWHLVRALGSHLGPLLAIYGLVCWKRLPNRATPPMEKDALRVMNIALAGMLSLLLIGILFFRVTEFRDRWFLPLCFWTPLLLVGIFSGRLNPIRIRRLLTLAAVVALVVTVLIPARVRFAKTFKVPQNLNAPYAQLARELRSNVPTVNYIIAGDNWVGGNLKLWFPEKFILSPRIFLERQPQADEASLLVWDATRNAALPEKLMAFAASLAEVNSNELRYIEAPLQFWPARRMKIGFTTCRFRGNAESASYSSADQP